MNVAERKETINLLVTARDSVNDAIRNINASKLISPDPPKLPTFSPLVYMTESEWDDGWPGVEDEFARMCDVVIDGIEGQMIVERNYVGIYFPTNHPSKGPDCIDFYRDFGKSDGNDDFIDDMELGYAFAKYLIETLPKVEGFGLDDLRDQCNMKQH